MFSTKGTESIFPRTGDDIMEISLMMSRNQFEALEQRARAEGMSIAQFLRRLVNESVADALPV